MSTIQADVVSALAGVAGDQVYPGAAPENFVPPLVIMRRVAYEPQMVLTGRAGFAKSTFIFECYGAKSNTSTAKASALATAKDVCTALDAAPESLTRYQESVDGEQFDPDTLEQMEPVSYSFWHDDP